MNFYESNKKQMVDAVSGCHYDIYSIAKCCIFAADGVVSVSTKEEFVAAVNDTSITQIRVTGSIDLTHPNGEDGSDVLNVSGKTIDLGGNTISANNFTLIFQGSNFTIQNGIFSANGESYALFIGDNGTTDTVLIQNIETEGGINVFNASNITLRDVDVTGTQYYAVWCDEVGQVKIESGTFQSNGNAVLGLTTVESTLDISGGTFIVSDGQPLVLEDADKWGEPVITGGVYNIDPANYVSADSDFIRYTNAYNKTTYALGSSIHTVLANAGKGDTVTVL